MKACCKLIFTGLFFPAVLVASSFPFAIATSAEPKVSQSNTLEEYAQMSRDEQRQLILDKREEVALGVVENDPERAMCIANIGVDQFNDIKGILNKAAERTLPISAQNLVERVMKERLCPE